MHRPRLLLALLALAACQATPAPSSTTTQPSPLPAAGAVAPAPSAKSFAVKVTGSGPPMVLIPGLGSSGEVWDSTVAHFQDRYTCHVLTLAGFAGQPPITEPLLPAVRRDLATYLHTLGAKRSVVIGHSLGGMIALDLAGTEPELVGALVVVDALPYAGAEIPAARVEPMRAHLLGVSADAFRAEQEMVVATMVTAPVERTRVAGWTVASDRRTLADVFAAVLTTDLREKLAAIRARSLVIATWQGSPGESHDSVAATFKAQYAALHGAEITVDDRARHFVMLDDPQGFDARLETFLR